GGEHSNLRYAIFSSASIYSSRSDDACSGDTKTF
ncbi:hypothetical protein MTO96_044828, partial [Rhipicephalus appendiculatus]